MITDQEIQLLQALAIKPLSVEEVLIDMFPWSESEIKQLLYQMDHKYLITKQPVIGGGCRTCASEVKFLWRLTFAGRAALLKRT